MCLNAFRERCLGFSIRGTPVGCVAVEILLSGNGLQLSKRFCTNLRAFCFRAGIAIVADEILTGFRCQCTPTVLLSDEVNLQPDFIVLGKFIGCGVVLQDKSVSNTMWLQRRRRYPTTNCSMDQLLGLSSVLRKVFEVLQRDPTIFHKVETAVKEVHPSAVGRGLIWFFNRSGTRAVPAPQGVKRLLIKLFPTTSIRQFKTALSSHSCLGQKLTRHVKSFQSLVREFSVK